MAQSTDHCAGDEQTATYLELEKVGGKGPVAEAVTMVREGREVGM